MSELSPGGRETLLRLARASIQEAVRSDGALPPLLERTTIAAELESPRGAFVTLRKPAEGGNNALRGCIGSVVAAKPLYRTVIELAPKAALEDPRFPPLGAEELDGLQIEVSVLTPLSPLERVDDLVLGRDGVQLKKGAVHAVFLPQVAKEHDWTVEQLLTNLARKAGLDQSAWSSAELSVFQAEVFGDGVRP